MARVRTVIATPETDWKKEERRLLQAINQSSAAAKGKDLTLQQKLVHLARAQSLLQTLSQHRLTYFEQLDAVAELAPAATQTHSAAQQQ